MTTTEAFLAEAGPLLDQAFEVLWPLCRPENEADFSNPPTQPGWYWDSISKGRIISLIFVHSAARRQTVTRHVHGAKWNGNAGYFLTDGMTAESFALGIMPDGDQWVSTRGSSRVSELDTGLAETFLSAIRTTIAQASPVATS